MGTIIKDTDFIELNNKSVKDYDLSENKKFEDIVNSLFLEECISESQDIKLMSDKDVQLGKLFVAINYMAGIFEEETTSSLKKIITDKIMDNYDIFNALTKEEINQFIEILF